MFNDLSEKLQGVFKKLKRQGKLSEQNIKDSMREIRMALLEADVNYKIVKNFIKAVEERCLGQEVMISLTPGQQVVKIVNEQLVSLMDTGGFNMDVFDNKLTTVMLVGLQGSGKTTACAKLANYYRKKKIRPMMVACDIYRPAAVHQLQVLGKQINIPVIYDDSNEVTKIAAKALKEAQRDMTNLLLFDTAGRLHIDENMMQEIYDLKKQIKPDYILFVADSMTGQDAVTVAKQFNEKMDFSGVILTKLDGDARGGAALSIKAVTGKPVVFVGMGEKVSDLELFHADRMASRILGMGDVLSLIEKAEETFDEKEAEKLAAKMKKNQFDLNDFLSQLQQIKKMGPLDSIIKMIPGMNTKMLKDTKIDEKQLAHIEAIIKSMTNRERAKPQVLNGSRRKRIALGAGRTVQEVNKLLRNFEDMKKMMKKMTNPKFAKQFKGLGM